MVSDIITSAMVLAAYFVLGLGLAWAFYQLWW